VSLCTNTVASAQIIVQESIIFAEGTKTQKKWGGAQECYSKTALSVAHYKMGMSVHGVTLCDIHMQGY